MVEWHCVGFAYASVLGHNYVGLITNGVLPTVNELVMHWMLHPHPISLVSWSSCSQSLEHDPASVTNLNDAICNICYPGNEAVHVHYVTLYKHLLCGVVWCGVPPLPCLFLDSVRA